jgi:hypothetical protein
MTYRNTQKAGLSLPKTDGPALVTGNGIRALRAREIRKTPEYKAWRAKHQKLNREKLNERQRAYRASPAGRAATKAYNDKYKAEKGEQKRAQNRISRRRKLGLPEPTRPEPANCECCGRARSSMHSSLALDHDHVTGEFRGWLCYRCNSALGKLGDNVDGLLRAMEYLERAEGQ